MAEALKVLGQSAPGAAATIIYTVPALKSAVVSKLFVAHGGAIGQPDYTYRVAVNPAGGAGMAAPGMICYDAVIKQGEAHELLAGLAIAAGATVVVYASNANVGFTLSGSEIT